MADGYYRGVPGGSSRSTMRIYLKHHANPALAPRSVTCQDYEKAATRRSPARIEKGCGGTVFRYATYPNQKGVRFDSAPVVVEGTETSMGDGGIVAEVYTDNVHFATCTARHQVPETSGVEDTKAQAAGE